MSLVQMIHIWQVNRIIGKILVEKNVYPIYNRSDKSVTKLVMHDASHTEYLYDLVQCTFKIINTLINQYRRYS